MQQIHSQDLFQEMTSFNQLYYAQIPKAFSSLTSYPHYAITAPITPQTFVLTFRPQSKTLNPSIPLTSALQNALHHVPASISSLSTNSSRLNPAFRESTPSFHIHCSLNKYTIAPFQPSPPSFHILTSNPFNPHSQSPRNAPKVLT